MLKRKLGIIGILGTSLPLLLLTGNSAIAANLIGDMLTFRRAFPDINTDYSPPVMTTVTNDDSDIVVLQSPFWTINPDADGIFIDVNGNSSMGGSDTIFDGIIISGFSHPIVNAFFTTNDSDFVFDFTFDSSSIFLNLTGNFDGSEFIDIQVQTETVPEPFTLLGSGLVMGFLLSLRKNTSSK